MIVEVSVRGEALEVEEGCPYGKFVLGWADGGGCPGVSAGNAWDQERYRRPAGCSWRAFGLLCARERAIGRGAGANAVVRAARAAADGAMG